MKTLTLGLVGGGRIGQMHAQNLLTVRDQVAARGVQLEIVLADADPQAAAAAADSLARLKEVAATDDNLMEASLVCARAGVTVGEGQPRVHGRHGAGSPGLRVMVAPSWPLLSDRASRWPATPVSRR